MHKNWDLARESSYQITEVNLNTQISNVKIVLSLVNNKALTVYYHDWTSHPNRNRTWPWDSYVREIRLDDPSCFELAIWGDGVLCGLAIGEGSATDNFCACNFLESTPEPLHPLKSYIFEIMLNNLIVYAILLDRKSIRIINPSRYIMERSLIHGFKVVYQPGKWHYLERRIP